MIAAYVPVGPEPGGADLPSVLAATGARVILPVLRPDNDLDWAVFTGSLVPGPRGLSEPTGERLGVDGIRSASLILVPALAVDRAGQRLGRGGGSYDRALDRASRLDAGSPIDGSPIDGSLTGGPLTDDPGIGGPLIAGPGTGGPLITGPGTDGPLITGPGTDGPLITGPRIDGPLITGPRIDGPGIVGSLIVALLHDGELIESVPAEAHDRPVHGVITPTGGFVRF